MFLFPLLLAWLAAQVALLGHDEYAVREAAQRRLDHPVWIALLPAATDSPEAAARIADLKKRHRRPTAAEVQLRIELEVRDADLPRWLSQYVVPGRSSLPDAEVFAFLHAEWKRAEAFFRLWSLRPGDSTSWLTGAIFPGEYDRWLDHCDYHRGVAPRPREK